MLERQVERVTVCLRVGGHTRLLDLVLDVVDGEPVIRIAAGWNTANERAVQPIADALLQLHRTGKIKMVL